MSSVSLLPRDVGFDLKVIGHPVHLAPDVTSVQYLDAEGNPTVIAGNRAGIVAALTEAGYLVESERHANDYRRLVFDAADAIMALKRAHSHVKVPTIIGTDEHDVRVVEAFLGEVALQAAGHEPTVHDGATFDDRVAAAKAILEIWATIQK